MLNFIFNLNGLSMLLEWVYYQLTMKNQQVFNFLLKIAIFQNICSTNIETQLDIHQIFLDMTMKTNKMFVEWIERNGDFHLNSFGRVSNTLNLDWTVVLMQKNSSLKSGLSKLLRKERQRKVMMSSLIKSMVQS